MDCLTRICSLGAAFLVAAAISTPVRGAHASECASVNCSSPETPAETANACCHLIGYTSGQYYGYVSARGIVLGDDGIPTWVSYKKSEYVDVVVTDRSGQQTAGKVLIQGLEQERRKADGIYKDAEVMTGTEFRYYQDSFEKLSKSAEVAGHFELLKVSAFKTRTFKDSKGHEIPRGELADPRRSRVVMVRSSDALTVGKSVVIAEYPVDPTAKPAVSSEHGVVYNLLVSTQTGTEGNVILASEGVISYLTDFITPMSEEKQRKVAAAGICDQSALREYSYVGLKSGETVQYTQEDQALRFERCDAWLIDWIGPRDDARMKVWGPLVDAFVDSGSRWRFPGNMAARTDENGHYTLDYPYQAGMEIWDDLHVGMTFAAHNPKVPFGSRYFEKRQVAGGATFSMNPGAIESIANNAALSQMTGMPMEDGPLIDAISGPPEIANYMAWMAGILYDSHTPRSYNVAIDVAYIFGKVALRNEQRGAIKLAHGIPASISIDDFTNTTHYGYTKPNAAPKSLVQLQYPQLTGYPDASFVLAAPAASAQDAAAGGAGDGGVPDAAPPTYGRWLTPDASDASTTPSSDGDEDEDAESLEVLVDRGLVTNISRADLSNTDLYVFGADGQLIGSRNGLRVNETNGMKCTGNEDKRPFAGYTGACSNGQAGGCVNCVLDPQPTESAPHAALFNLQTFISPRVHGNRYDILLINRATGYVGTGYIDLTKVYAGEDAQGQSAIPDANALDQLWRPRSGLDEKPIYAKDGSSAIAMRPPNLTIRARRTPASVGALQLGAKEYLVGFEGAGLASDILFQVETEWKDWDGSPLPPLPEIYVPTGRLARATNGSAAELGKGESLMRNFPVKVNGPHTFHLRTPSAFAENFHYYVHVVGQAAASCAGNAECTAFAETVSDASDLQYRPARYTPFKVPVYDGEATVDALKASAVLARETGLSTIEKAQPIYREVYRPEYQFTIFELPELEAAQTITRYDESKDKSSTTLNFGYSLTTSGSAALPQLGTTNTPLWSLGYDELQALATSAGTKSTAVQFDNLEQLLLLTPARQLLEVENMAANLTGSNFLALQLYLDNDRGNALYENYSVPLLLTEAAPIDLNRHVNLAQFRDDVPNPETIEDYRAVRFALTARAKLKLEVAGCGDGAEPINLLDQDTIRDPGVYYFILDTEKLKQKDLPSNFTLAFIATPEVEKTGDTAPKSRDLIQHRVEFPVTFTTHVGGETLGEVIEHDVNIVDGTLKLSRQDFAFEGRGPNLAMERSYSNTSGGGSMGPGWSHGYENQLIPVATSEYASSARPEWLQNFKAGLAEASLVEKYLYHPEKPIELTMVMVNGTTFHKVGSEWVREYGRHGRLEQRAEETCYPNEPVEMKGCFVYFSPDGTSYRYRVPDPKTFNPPELKTNREMVGSTNGLAFRAGLDPNELVIPDLKDAGPGKDATLTPLADELPTWTPGRYKPLPLLSITDKYGNRLNLEYQNGRVSKVVDATSRTCEFTYEPYPKCDPAKVRHCDRLSKITCFKGQTDEVAVSYAYDESGLLTKATRGARVEEYGYATVVNQCGVPDTNLSFTRKDPWSESGKTTYVYREDRTGLAKEELGGHRDPALRIEMVDHVVYPATAAVEGGGVLTVTFAYDGAAHTREVASIVSGQDQTKSYVLTDAGNPSTITEPLGKVTTMQWSGAGCTGQYRENVLVRKTVKRDPQTTLITTYDYDTNGNVTSECGPGNQTITQEWSRFGELISRSDSLHGTSESWTVREGTNQFGDPFDYVVAHIDRAGVTTSFTPDLKGRVLEETVEGSDPPRTTSYGYDQWGNLASVNVRNHAGVSYDRDIRGRVRAQHNALNRSTTYQYNTNDEIETITLPALVPVAGQASDMDVHSASVLTFTYDAAGNKLTETDRNGVVLTHEYTPLGQVKKTTRSFDQAYREFKYDELGHLTQETDWEGNSTRYFYDALGYQERIVDRLGNPMFTHRDFVGNVLQTIDYGGLATYFTYDLQGKEESRRIQNCGEDDCGEVSHFGQPAVGSTLTGVAYTISHWDEFGRETINGYDGLERLVYRRNPDASVHTWTFDAAGMLKQTVNEEGVTTRYGYDARGFMTSTEVQPITGRTGESIRTEYVPSDTGTILQETRYREGHAVNTTYGYDAWDRMVSRVRQGLAGQEITTYDGQGNVVAQRDVAGNQRYWYRDELGRTLAQVDAETQVGNLVARYPASCENLPVTTFTECYQYYPNGTLRRKVDARGVSTDYSYDLEERETARIETGGSRSRQWEVLERDPMGNISVLRDYAGKQTTFGYTNRHLLSVKSDGVHATYYTYTASGKVRTETSPRGFVRTYTYYSLNDRLQTVTYRAENGNAATEASYTYDRVGNVLTSTNQAGEVTEKRYDGLLRHEYTYQNGTRVLTNEYDEQSNITATIDGEQNRTEYEYDDMNRVTNVRYADGAQIVRSYASPLGQMSSETIPGGYTTTLGYDREGRMTSRSIGSEMHSYAYDLAGNVVSETQPEGQANGKFAGKVKQFRYDAFGRLDRVTDEVGISTDYHVDDMGNLDDIIGPTDPSATYPIPHVHRTYDPFGRLTAETHSLGSGAVATVYGEFDGHDNPHSVTTPMGAIAYDYDKYDRPSSISYQAGATGTFGIASTTRNFDDAANRLTITESKRTPSGAALVDTTVELNNIGTDWTRRSTQRGSEIAYEYYRNGAKKSVASAGGTTSYTYDARNRPKTVTTPEGEVVYDYDDAARTTVITFPNGTTTTYLQNDTGRVRSITHRFTDNTTTVISYQYDRNGNPTQITDRTDGVDDVTELSEYDAIGRLRQFSQGGKTTVYEYQGYDRYRETVHDGDVNGNVSKTKAYSYDQMRRLQTVVEHTPGFADVTVTYAYDLNGNLLSRTSSNGSSDDATFTYNARDQLVRVTRGPPGGQISVGQYDYDSTGNRIRQLDTDRGEVESIYDDDSVLEEHLTSNGVTERYRLHYGHALLARLGANGTSHEEYYHQDVQGSTRHLSNASGLRQGSYRYDPWGNVREQPANTINRISYTQQQYDKTSGLYYYGARYYDPQIGRFLTRDGAPGDAHDPPSLNAYLYAFSNPAKYIDPSGHSAVEANPAAGAAGSFGGSSEVIGAGNAPQAWTAEGADATAAYTVEDPSGRGIGGVALRSATAFARGVVRGVAGRIGGIGTGLGKALYNWGAEGVGIATDFGRSLYAGDFRGAAAANLRWELFKLRTVKDLAVATVEGVITIPKMVKAAGEGLGDAAWAIHENLRDPAHANWEETGRKVGEAGFDAMMSVGNVVMTVVGAAEVAATASALVSAGRSAAVKFLATSGGSVARAEAGNLSRSGINAVASRGAARAASEALAGEAPGAFRLGRAVMGEADEAASLSSGVARRTCTGACLAGDAAGGCFVAGTPVLLGSGAAARAIEQLRLGERVASGNAACDDEHLEPETLTISVELPNLEQPLDSIRIALARSAAWLSTQLFDAEGRLWIDLAEIGASGWGTITNIARGPVEQAGPGCLVLTTIDRRAPRVLKLTLADGSAPIELTPAHRLYLEGRGWTAAGEFRPGDRLRSDSGAQTIASIEDSRPNQRVYNLEASLEHAYRVGDARLWSHNTCPLPGAGAAEGGLSRGAYLRQKFSHLTPEQRAAYFEQLAEGSAKWRLAKLSHETPGAHFIGRHGAEVSTRQLVTRANTGWTPDLVKKGAVDSSRFTSYRAQYAAIERAMARANGASGAFDIQFEYAIGELVPKYGSVARPVYSARVILKDGKPYTAWTQ